jgi:hypothetical protein
MRRSNTIRSLDFYGVKPWRCEHHDDRSEILAYLDPRRGWERVATVWPRPNERPRVLAEFVVKVINASASTGELMQEAHEALVELLKEGLNFSTEQAGEKIVAELAKRVA